MNKKTTLIVAGALLLGVAGLVVRGRGPGGPSPAPTTTLVIKGSDTMVNLSQAWAEAYMQKDPTLSVSVTGGGSGTGIAAFLNKTCDIANSSREMKDEEVIKAKELGIVRNEVKCGLDGLAIAVSDKNPLTSITLEQLKLIYTGKLTDWKELGAPPGKIVVCSRENNSGTYVFFQEHVLNKESFASNCLFLPSTKAIATELAGGANGIGYGGIAYFKDKPGIKMLPVAKKKGDKPVAATDETVIAGTYPISRPLLMYTVFQPKPEIQKFLDFCLSKEGQAIVAQIGYVPLKK